MMQSYIGVVMAVAVLAGVRAKAPHNVSCGDGECFIVFKETADFVSAQKKCKEIVGDLMTVRTAKSNHVLSRLINDLPGDFWIGLKYSGERCSDASSVLKGYTWTTGDNTTDYENWKNNGSVCSPHCVSVSREDLTWTERPCSDAVQGYLCEYKDPEMCDRLPSDGKTSVLYTTHWGFEGENLISLPQGSIGTHRPEGTRHLCFSRTWRKAPWSCEVFSGGCEQNCAMNGTDYQCTCSDGYVIAENGVSCIKAPEDPCDQAGCAQRCSKVNNTVQCHCDHGYELGKDGKSCNDIDECADKSRCSGEHMECVNKNGSFECRCKSGYEMNNNTCTDLNECALRPCEHDCINTNGDFDCVCFDGYIVSPTVRTRCDFQCSRRECPIICDRNTGCKCPVNYVADKRETGTYCVDIDECQGLHMCDHRCNNTFGGYVCSCWEGFELVEEHKCRKISSPTTPRNLFTSTVRTTTSPRLSAVAPVGIVVLIVATSLFIIYVVRFIIMARCKLYNLNAHKRLEEDDNDSQLTLKKYIKKSTTSDWYMKQEIIDI